MAKDPRQGEVALAQHLNRRIGAVLESIPGYADLRSGAAPSPHFPEDDAPSWMRIPIWLDESWAEERSERPPGGALAELLWGQYALFLSLRLKDDLLDGQRDDLRLFFVADCFLLESLGSFQRFPELDERFWAFYRSCVRGTIDGAMEVGRLEKEPGRFRAEHLGLHARVSSSMKVGAAAVCRLHGREQELEWLSRVQDELAIVNQIDDDLKDLADDLKAGRYTWVGNTILAAEPGEPIAPDEWASRLGTGLMRPERGAAVVEELRRAVRAAATEVPASAPRRMRDMVERLGDTPDALERSMHEARVRWVFGEALAQEH